MDFNTLRPSVRQQRSDRRRQVRNPETRSGNSGRRTSRSDTRGFTLLELMVVIGVIMLLAAMSIPVFRSAIVHAREAVLKDDLHTLRKLVDQYTLDKRRPPTSLDDLVESGYLRGGIPVDPITGSNESWQTSTEDAPLDPNQASAGIVDVHSGSEDTALDGTPYSSW